MRNIRYAEGQVCFKTNWNGSQCDYQAACCGPKTRLIGFPEIEVEQRQIKHGWFSEAPVDLHQLWHVKRSTGDSMLWLFAVEVRK